MTEIIEALPLIGIVLAACILYVLYHRNDKDLP